MSNSSTPSQTRALQDPELRHARNVVNAHWVEHARAPTVAQLESLLSVDTLAVHQLLQRLHNAHALYLEEGHHIRMVWPFSNVETPHAVHAGGRTYHANCAWDAFGIPAALQLDADLEVRCAQTGEPLPISIRGGELVGPDARVHFARPFADWYEDLVAT